MTERQVFYVGPFSFPWGEAASRRVVGMASSIAASGRNVTVIPGRGVVGELVLPPGLLGGVSVVGHVDELVGGRGRRAWAWSVGMGRLTRSAIEQRALPSHVIVYGGSFPYLMNLSKWCRKRRVPLLLDMVEWYDPRTFPGGRWGPIALADGLARKRLHAHADGVIAISTLLRDHYAGMGIPVALVPPTVIAQPGPREIPALSPLRIVYAGTPGAKDDLRLMLRAFCLARATAPNIEFVIAGASAQTVEGLLESATLPDGVRVMGHVDQEEISGLLKSAHFTILVRQQKLSSNAGFPTKYVESCLAGVPVIGNITGDLGSYLKNGETGFVVTPDVEDLANALVQAASLDDSQYSAMARAASANTDAFFYEQFVDTVDSLLRQCQYPGA